MSHVTERLLSPPESTISVRVVRALADRLERIGVDRERVLQDCGIALDSRDLRGDDEVRVSRSQVCRLFEAAVAVSGDHAFGLHWLEHSDVGVFGPISQLVTHASTLREALAALARYHRLFSDWNGFAVEELDGLVVVRCLEQSTLSPQLQRFMAEIVVVSIYKLLAAFGAQAQPRCVCFSYPAPEYQAEYTRAFAGAERFEQPYTGIVLDRAAMDKVSPQHDEAVFSALRTIAEQRLQRLLKRIPYTLRVREHLVANGCMQRTRMSDVARGLGISVRSLRRRLEAEGTGYNKVVDESLGILAKQLMSSNWGRVEEVALEMGFANTSSFHRAFKRWTGMTPHVYRAEHTDTPAPPRQPRPGRIHVALPPAGAAAR
jgi:AraC-like DNA-binding protein